MAVTIALATIVLVLACAAIDTLDDQ